MNEVSAGAWRLYCFLARCRNQKSGKCCPSVSTSAEAIDVHPKNIFKLRKELIEADWAQFTGDSATFLLGFESSKNATANDADAGDIGESSKNATPKSEGSKNATYDAASKQDAGFQGQSSKNTTQASESQKRYPMVAKTLPDGSKNATAYKEEPAKEPIKRTSKERAHAPEEDEINAIERAIIDRYEFKVIQPDLERRIKTVTGSILAAGFTTAQLKAFFAFRQKTPSLNYLAQDLQQWAADQKRSVNGCHSPPVIACHRCRDRGFYGTPTGTKACDCEKGKNYAR